MKRSITLPFFLTAVALAFVLGCGAAEMPTQAPATPLPPAPPQPAPQAQVAPTVAPQQPATPLPAPTAAPLRTDIVVPPAVAVIPTPPRVLPTPVPPEARRFGGTLKWIPQGSVASLDPHVTSAAVTLGYGYNLYDTLISWDKDGALQPQMLTEWTVEDGGKRFAFKLRDGLKFHDGRAVTTDDVIASLNRWRQRAAYGPFFNNALQEMKKIDDKSFVAQFNEPVGIFLQGIGIPTVPYPVIMPASAAATPSSELVGDHTGSGPFKLVKWELGNRIVLDKFVDYKPRSESPSFLAGGKIAYLDRLEMIEVPDQETRAAALITGEVDFLDIMSLDFYNTLQKSPRVEVEIGKPGSQPIFHFNKSIPPFDMTPKGLLMRRAVQALTNAEEIMQGYGPRELWTLCPSMWSCGTFFANAVVPEKYNMNNVELARQLLKEAGYAGEPITLLDPADFPTIHPIPIVLKSQLERAGINVNYRVTDWATQVRLTTAAADAPASREWNIAPTWLSSWAFLPLASGVFRSDGVGFYKSSRVDELRKRFAQGADPTELKKIADEMQRVFFEEVPYVHLGNFFQLRAMNKDLEGLIASPVGGAYFVGLYWQR